MLKIDSELEKGDDTASLLAIDDVFKNCRKDGHMEEEMIPVTNPKESEMLLDQLMAETADTSGGFTAEWEKAFQSQNELPKDEYSDFMSQTATERKHSISNQSFLPSQLFDFGNLSSAPPSGNMPKGMSGAPAGSGAGKSKDMSQWFSLFADLDPLANPDDVGSQKTQWEGGC